MKSIKLAIIALLGFSTACSTVKEGSKSKTEEPDKVEVKPSIVVMYGVRRPVEPAPEIKKVEAPVINDESSASEKKSETKEK